MGIDGAGAAQVAAHRTRDSKELVPPEEVLARHRELAAQYGHQADRVVAEARAHEQRQVYEPDRIAQQAVTYAREHLFERSAVLDRRDFLEAALNRGIGETTYTHVRQEFEQRVGRGEFCEVNHVGAGQHYTTATMLRMEREIVQRMHEGNQRGMNDPMLVDVQIRLALRVPTRCWSNLCMVVYRLGRSENVAVSARNERVNLWCMRPMRGLGERGSASRTNRFLLRMKLGSSKIFMQG